MTYYKKTKSSLKKAIFQLFGHKTPVKEETAQDIEKFLCKICFGFFYDPKLYDAYQFLKKFKISVP
jgi:hypothetical protein